ncbi:MAG: hypothetical protein ACK5JH_13340 [Anaerocolumna sp.]
MGTMRMVCGKTTDSCKTWEKIDVCESGGIPEKNIAFVEIDKSSGVNHWFTLRIEAS